jgi:phosphatidylserine/phosphatidylglycerophosphate/cardiolipin synthase-like enzyme
MKKLPLSSLVFVALLTLVVAAFVAGNIIYAQSRTTKVQPPPPLPIDIYFSPRGGCTEACIKEINAAQKMILVQAYSFTSAPIAEALKQAHKRGVDVKVILDKSQRTEKYSMADFLIHGGIPTFIDARHAIAHNKIMIIDSDTVITGSFNFTKQAEEQNAENLLVIRDQKIAEKYTSRWDVHGEHSEPYEAKEKGYSETHDTGKAAPTNPAPKAGDATVGGYVASARSQVFHKAGCKGAAKISEKNLVKYATRDEAIAAGKKPCRECNP